MSRFIFLLIIYLPCSRLVAWVAPSMNRADYDRYGSLLAMNKHVIIFPRNDIKQFQIITDPFLNRSCRCSFRYRSVRHATKSFTDYIHSVTIGSNQERAGNKMHFAYIDEDSRRNIFLTIVYYVMPDTVSICNDSISHLGFNLTKLSFSERAVIGMDPQGTRIYIVGSPHILVVDIRKGTKQMYEGSYILSLRSVEPSSPLVQTDMFPKAVSVTKDQLLQVVGHYYSNYQFLAYLHVFDLNYQNRNQVQLVSSIPLSELNYGTAATDLSRESMISLSVDEEEKRMIIGIPYIDTVLLLRLNGTEKPEIIKRHESRGEHLSFGKSVVLLPENTYAVLAYTQPTLPWSTSQVQIYSLNDDSKQPLFVYPNNQQVMPTINLIRPPYGILIMAAYQSNIVFVVEGGGILILPPSPPGYCSSKIENNIFDAGNYTSLPCPPGTARSTSSFGPCLICPSHTKNNGSSGSGCQPCSNNSSLLCLRGTPNEIELPRLSSFGRPDFYPVSPEATEFDDVLLQHVFMFDISSAYCLIISPLFWVTVIIGCSFILIIGISWCDMNKQSRYSTIKSALTHLDLIGGGKLWFGGIISLAIIVLIGFTMRITVSFSQLYPIENTSKINHTSVPCQSDFLNSKFSSALQLLSTLKHEEEKTIFQLLDEQKLTLTAEFVSTQFSCEDVVMQRNMDKGQQIRTSDFSCISDQDSNILTLSTLLPQHLITVQYGLTGPSFIGGLRICLESPAMLQNGSRYTVHTLNVCQFFFTPNETLTTNAVINIKLTKSINVTVPLRSHDDTVFTGIWLATFTVNTLADALLFDQSGEYQRYLSDRMLLVIGLSESEYYMENSQEPIARQNEIVFHAVLFSMLCLDLFGFLYLFIKLTIVPFIGILGDRCSCRCHRTDPSESELHQFVQQHVDEAIKEWRFKKKPGEI